MFRLVFETYLQRKSPYHILDSACKVCNACRVDMRSGAGHSILVQRAADAAHAYKASYTHHRCSKAIAGHHRNTQCIQEILKEIGQADRHCLTEPGREGRLVPTGNTRHIQGHHQNKRKELHKTHGGFVDENSAADQYH